MLEKKPLKSWIKAIKDVSKVRDVWNENLRFSFSFAKVAS